MKKLIILSALFSSAQAMAQLDPMPMNMFSHLHYHGVPAAWEVPSMVPGRLFKRKGDDIVVAVVDSGVASFHPQLAPHMKVNPIEGARFPNIPSNGVDDDGNGLVDDYLGWDFVYKNSVSQDANGHGTHVAGIIARVAPNAKILPIRVLDFKGNGSTDDTLEGIRYAVKYRGTRVINLSLGVVDVQQVTKPYFLALAEEAKRLDILLVIAAGNDNSNNDFTPVSPANIKHPNVITVCSVDNQGFRSDFSNYGAESVDLCALGTDVTSLNHMFYQGEYKVLSGTSMATPFVSGVAALIFSHNPKFSAAQVRQILVESVRRETFQLFGQNYSKLSGVSNTQGVLDAKAALELAAKRSK